MKENYETWLWRQDVESLLPMVDSAGIDLEDYGYDRMSVTKQELAYTFEQVFIKEFEDSYEN